MSKKMCASKKDMAMDKKPKQDMKKGEKSSLPMMGEKKMPKDMKMKKKG